MASTVTRSRSRLRGAMGDAGRGVHKMNHGNSSPAEARVKLSCIRVRSAGTSGAICRDRRCRPAREEHLPRDRFGRRHSYWQGLEDAWSGRPIHITLVNLGPRPCRMSVSQRAGDACDLAQFADRSFDVVHVTFGDEHVGNWSRKKAWLRRSGDWRAVLCSNAEFLVSGRAAFQDHRLSMMPRPLQRSLVMSAARGFHPQAKTLDQADNILNDASLLDRRNG